MLQRWSLVIVAGEGFRMTCVKWCLLGSSMGCQVVFARCSSCLACSEVAKDIARLEENVNNGQFLIFFDNRKFFIQGYFLVISTK